MAQLSILMITVLLNQHVRVIVAFSKAKCHITNIKSSCRAEDTVVN